MKKRVIYSIGIFLLTFAIGMSVHGFIDWHNSPQSYRDYEDENIGHGC